MPGAAMQARRAPAPRRETLPPVRRIERLRALILPDNAPVIALLSKYAPTIRLTYDGDLLRADVPLARYALSAAA
jgi:hypothetical protein